MNRDSLIKKLKYRSNYRGNKEMDIIFARFNDKHLDNLPLDQLYEFEKIINQQDADLYLWIQNPELTPENISKDIILAMSLTV